MWVTGVQSGGTKAFVVSHRVAGATGRRRAVRRRASGAAGWLRALRRAHSKVTRSPKLPPSCTATAASWPAPGKRACPHSVVPGSTPAAAAAPCAASRVRAHAASAPSSTWADA